jgi:hypothetical protein
MNTEIWKPVNLPRYEEYYEASTFGNVRNKKTGKILKQSLRNSYLAVCLCYVDNKNHSESVHRIIAKTFIENPNNYNIVNHKDCNKLNNNVENLEWCSMKKNVNHAIINDQINFYKKQVQQYTLDGILINTFSSIREAEEKTGAHNTTITQCCKEKVNTAGGFIWKYADIYEPTIDENTIQGVKVLEFPNYIVTREGKIYSLNTKKFMNPEIRNDSSLVVVLRNKNIKKHEFVHKLVAKLYIPNPENKQCVHHINRDKKDNRVENLCWSTVSEGLLKYNSKNKVPVLQYDKNGNFIKEHMSNIDAHNETKIDSSSIRKTCLGEQKHAGGYIWKFKENTSTNENSASPM